MVSGIISMIMEIGMELIHVPLQVLVMASVIATMIQTGTEIICVPGATIVAQWGWDTKDLQQIIIPDYYCDILLIYGICIMPKIRKLFAVYKKENFLTN